MSGHGYLGIGYGAICLWWGVFAALDGLHTWTAIVGGALVVLGAWALDGTK